MSSPELGPYVLAAFSWIICLAAIAFAVIAARRSSRTQFRWKQVAAAADLNRSLDQTGDAILTLLSAEVAASSWALYGYDERRQYFRLVTAREDRSGKAAVVPQLSAGDPGASPETPASLPSDAGARPLGVYQEHGLSILNIPLLAGKDIAGVARGLAVPPSALASVEKTLKELQEPIGQILRAADEREHERQRLADFEAGSQMREALLQSAFSADRMVENTLGVVTLSTQSSGAFVRLNFAAFDPDGHGTNDGDYSFAAGDVREILLKDAGGWQQLETALAEAPILDRSNGGSSLLGSMPIDYVLAVPVEMEQRRAGMLILVRKGETPYRPGDVHLARVFAEQIGRLLANMQAYHVAEDSYRSTLITLVDLVDGRMPQSAGHSARVMQLSVMTGEALGITGPELDALRWAALLHDVGMCSIGEGVLKTRGKLSDEEFVRIRQHPHLGALMCNPIQTPQAVSPAVRTHHERWDGRGYPDGLTGDQIPLHGRIIALAEVFNAHVTAREYRPAKSRAEAIRLIELESGHAFDPRIVEKFLQVIPRESEKLAGAGGDPLTSSMSIGENNG